MTLGAPRVSPLPLWAGGAGRGLGSSLFPGQEGRSSTIRQCHIMVAVEGPYKTVWQVVLNQSEPEGPQELPGNPSWRSEQ